MKSKHDKLWIYSIHSFFCVENILYECKQPFPWKHKPRKQPNYYIISYLTWNTKCSSISSMYVSSIWQYHKWSLLPVNIFWNAVSTLVESKADVSMKDKPFLSANALASSVGTARRCLKSDLFPTNMITIFWSAWSRNSRNHLSTFSYVRCFAISYTSSAPTAPR